MKPPAPPRELTADEQMKVGFFHRVWEGARLGRDHYLSQQDKVLGMIEAGDESEETAMMLVIIQENLRKIDDYYGDR